jgi:hypothetical protein
VNVLGVAFDGAVVETGVVAPVCAKAAGMVSHALKASAAMPMKMK